MTHKPSATSHQPSANLLSATGCLLCALALFALYILTLRLIADTHTHRAGNLSREGYYGLALSHLEKADHWRPGDYMIQKEMGNTYYKLAGLQPDAEKSFLLTDKAKEHYLETFRLNPLDAEAAYALARGEERLEQLDSYLHPGVKSIRHDPNPYFEEAVRLRPNGILYHYALARSLYRQGKEEELISVVRKLARIYPPSYHYLKKEAFWSPPVMDACKKGLQEAIDGDISPRDRDAHKSISCLMAAEEDWSGAISHYGQVLRYGTFKNTAGDYMHLGRLYLKDNQIVEAENSFLKSLDRSEDKERDLERIYGTYKREGHPDEFSRICRKAGDRYAGYPKMGTLLARSLIDLKQYNKARLILNDINLKEPVAEAWYLLARIAETEKDWDAMELAIQKATVYDPADSRYHLVFSQVLNRRKKLEGAEREADLAIKYQAKPSPWLYNHRAWIRWSRNGYPGAFRDWRAAIALKPDRASFYAQTAETCIKMGDLAQAVDYYQKAVKLEPENERYRKRYNKLIGN